jgi:hypothetical protein
MRKTTRKETKKIINASTSIYKIFQHSDTLDQYGIQFRNCIYPKSKIQCYLMTQIIGLSKKENNALVRLNSLKNTGSFKQQTHLVFKKSCPQHTTPQHTKRAVTDRPTHRPQVTGQAFHKAEPMFGPSSGRGSQSFWYCEPLQ